VFALSPTAPASPGPRAEARDPDHVAAEAADLLYFALRERAIGRWGGRRVATGTHWRTPTPRPIIKCRSPAPRQACPSRISRRTWTGVALKIRRRPGDSKPARSSAQQRLTSQLLPLREGPRAHRAARGSLAAPGRKGPRGPRQAPAVLRDSARIGGKRLSLPPLVLSEED